MTRIIPNEKTWVAFTETRPANLAAPTAAELGNPDVINLTPLLISLNASSQGNVVPTPDLSTLFETSIGGTVSATFTADFYRDDDETKDLAWKTLTRGKKGYFYISRFGGTGTLRRPLAGEDIEVWPIIVTARTAAPLASNTAQMFTLNAAVYEEPAENAVVA